MTQQPQHGGVLSQTLLEELSLHPPQGQGPLIHPLEPTHLKPAAYDLRIAADGMVTPDGDVIKPGAPPRRRPLVLEPGETAFVSTHEQLDVPAGLVGFISIKGTMARAGIILLTGSTVDAGWRKLPDEPAEGFAQPSGRDGRLHFTLANIGSKAVEIRPAVTKVVTIQFHYVVGDAVEAPQTDADDIWDDPPRHRLGFVEGLADVKGRVQQLEKTVERERRATEVITVAAFFVLAATILGVALASILSVVTNKRLVGQVERAIPDNADDRIFVLTVIVSIAWVIFSLSLLVGLRLREGPAGPSYDEEERRHWEALRLLSWRRRRNVVLVVCLGVGTVVVLIEIAILTELPAGLWFVVPLVAVLVVAFCAWAAERLRSPIREPDIVEEAKKLRDPLQPAGTPQAPE